MKKHKKARPDPFMQSLKEAQKDPEFINEVNRFIKAASGIYKL